MIKKVNEQENFVKQVCLVRFCKAVCAEDTQMDMIFSGVRPQNGDEDENSIWM